MDILKDYIKDENGYDEVVEDLETSNSYYKAFFDAVKNIDFEKFITLYNSSKISFFNQGVTYALYNKDESVEQIFPFDLIPRILGPKDWDQIENGVVQRNIALNMFIEDVYNDARILKDKVVPADLIYSSKHFCKEMVGFRPKNGIYCHISGTDIIRHSDGKFYVLEDNLRNPSGVSYVLTNRVALNRILPKAFHHSYIIESVSNYPESLLKMMWEVAPKPLGDIFCVLLTPGAFNSAYFEHTFLAHKMGIELVEGRDLFVENDYVYLKTIGGKIRVDVIYRRIDDAFLDPQVFNPESILGIKGVMGAYLKGNVNILNAPGTGMSDDKAVCAYVPDIIKYYLNEEAILPNVPTYICGKDQDLQFVLENIETLVVKPVDMSGGYGVCICDQMSKSEIDELIIKVKENPRNFIAQPKMYLSQHTTFIEDEKVFEPRHIDLRTFTLLDGKTPYVLKGGLTRTALKRGSLIVNSSQGGGSKDTWVIK